MFTVDTSEMRRLAADLGKISSRLLPEVDEALRESAGEAKGEMQAAFRGSRSFRGVASRVTFDRKVGVGSIEYEIGPERGGAGSLAHIAVDGGANGGGGTVDIDGPLAAQAAKVEKRLDGLLEELL